MSFTPLHMKSLLQNDEAAGTLILAALTLVVLGIPWSILLFFGNGEEVNDITDLSIMNLQYVSPKLMIGFSLVTSFVATLISYTFSPVGCKYLLRTVSILACCSLGLLFVGSMLLKAVY
jgi:hypothetical protein